MLRNQVPAISAAVGGLVVGTAAVLVLFVLAFAQEAVATVVYFCLLGGLPFASRASVGPEGAVFAGASVLALVAIPITASAQDPFGGVAALVMAGAGIASVTLLFLLRGRQTASRRLRHPPGADIDQD